jgi:hypothetical protein
MGNERQQQQHNHEKRTRSTSDPNDDGIHDDKKVMKKRMEGVEMMMHQTFNLYSREERVNDDQDNNAS